LLCPCLAIVRLCPADPVKGVRFASINCSAWSAPLPLTARGDRRSGPPSRAVKLWDRSSVWILYRLSRHFPQVRSLPRPARSRYWNRPTKCLWNSSRDIFAAIDSYVESAWQGNIW